MPRLHRVVAVARRDLAAEMGGRRRAFLPLLAGLVLTPLATAPSTEEVREIVARKVSGDVPEDVAALPGVRVVEGPARDAVHFVAPTPEDPQWVLHGSRVEGPVREAMDARETRVRIERIAPPELFTPKRSLLLALVATSLLTGSLAQSIAGERSQRTLETLLTAAITREELVLGKWLAWGGFGALASVLASTVAVALGRQEAGAWLLAAPWVSLGAAAMGFHLVRRARDVVGGATIALRMLPALLSILGTVAFVLGTRHPWLGASVPVGGVLLAAGDTWPGIGPTLWAIAVTAATSALMLRATARDLEPEPSSEAGPGAATAIPALLAAAVGWWLAVTGALAWTAGGSPERTEAIPAAAGPIAGGLALGAIVAVRLARAPRPAEELGLRTPKAAGWLAALGGAALLAPIASPDGLLPLADGGWPALLHARLAAAFVPDAPWGALLAIVTQEALFRGLLRRHLGDIGQAVAFAAIVTPFDPLLGLVTGLATGAAVRASGGSVLPAIAARLPVLLLPSGLLPPSLAVAVAGVAGAGLLLLALARREAVPEAA